MQRSEITPYWPYVPRRLILNPDFTHKVNAAERYARPFTLRTFMKYLLLSADEMELGLESYRKAAMQAPESGKLRAFREVLLAEQLQRMMRSEQALLEFEDLRFRVASVEDAKQGERMLRQMEQILKQEIKRTEAALETARRDSRLGYEWEQDYIYTPDTIEEKLKLLKVTYSEQIPRYCRQRGFNR